MSLNILMEPIYASLWAFMLFGNMPRLNMYIGGAVLLFGIYVFNKNNAEGPEGP
jgi:drug/metabolite transporter (DMT)-like permease